MYDSAALATETHVTTALAAYQPLLAGVTQTGSGSTLETNIASKLTLDAHAQANSNQCNLILKFDATYGSACFANASYWGWIPNASIRSIDAKLLSRLEPVPVCVTPDNSGW